MMELPWIMLSDPTNGLSPGGFESGNCTLDFHGDFSYTKSYVNRHSLERQRSQIYKAVLPEEQLQELKTLVQGIDSSTPKELWEGIVTDSSPGILSIFTEGRIVHTFCFHEFQPFEESSNPAFKIPIKIISILYDIRSYVTQDNAAL